MTGERIRENTFAVSTESKKKSTRGDKKTPPTTVRLFPALHDFVKAQAEQHPNGQSGVINDALEIYRLHVEKKWAKLRATMGTR